MLNGAPSSSNARDSGRSGSNTAHERSSTKSTILPTPPNSTSSAAAAAHRSHHSEKSSRRQHNTTASSLTAQQQQIPLDRNGTLNGVPGQTGSRESFLNYFFGGQPDAGAGPSAALGQGQDAASREVGGRHRGGSDYLPDLSKGEGRIGGRRGLEGSGAAFDMKSLGKHLEAVSRFFHPIALRPALSAIRQQLMLFLIFTFELLVGSFGSRTASTVGPRRDGDEPHPVPHLLLLRHRPSDYPRSSPQSCHACA
jgi:hypothetical protein